MQQYEINSWGLIKAMGDGNDDGDWLISGPIASTKPDYDGDTIFSKAVEKGLSMFDRLGGQVDWMHQFNKTNDPNHIVGRAVGYTKLNGQIWLTTVLDKTNELAQKIWRMVKATTADGKPLHKLGYSLLGHGVKDDKGNVTETEIHMVTLAPQPKGFDQFITQGAAPGRVFQICKALGSNDAWFPIEAALTTGDGVVTEGETGGAALRKQFLKGGTPVSTGAELEPVNEDGSPRKRRRKRKLPISKALVYRLEQIGSADPEDMAERITAIIMRGQFANN